MKPAPRQSTTDDKLQPVTAAILHELPRFRILVIGKSGAGKSTLINSTFNVKLASTSHIKAGVSDINEEITSPTNRRFVLHDSQGFEPGEMDNFGIVTGFIERRRQEPLLRNRLHAIWLCIEIPVSGGRAFETGDEDFLRLKLEGVPVIVVFTKYDKLVGAIDQKMEDDDCDTGRIIREADREFEQTCILRLNQILRRVSHTHPFAKVSVKPTYRDTLENLVRITQDAIKAKHPSLRSIPTSPSTSSESLKPHEADVFVPALTTLSEESTTDDAIQLTWAIAQRVSPDLNVQASIAVGKKKYWKCLSSSLQFPGKTLKDCLGAIHEDIINVWNFNDKDQFLSTNPALNLKARISTGLEELADREGEGPSTQITTGLTGLASMAGIVGAAAPPALPIVLPITAGLVMARWMYGFYKGTPGVVRCLMGYIVDLTIIMQNLFWIMHERAGTGPVTLQLLQEAVDGYYSSPNHTSLKVHQEIREFVQGMNLLRGSDPVLKQIIHLIDQHRFCPEETVSAASSSKMTVPELTLGSRVEIVSRRRRGFRNFLRYLCS